MRFLTLLLAATGAIPVVTASDAALLARLRATLDGATLELDAGRYERAGELFAEVKESATALGAPNLPLARAVDGLADVQRFRGRHAEAADLYRQSLRMWAALFGERQPRLATTLHNLALVHLAQDRPDLALPELRRALAIWDATLGADSPEARNTRRALRRVAPD